MTHSYGGPINEKDREKILQLTSNTGQCSWWVYRMFYRRLVLGCTLEQMREYYMGLDPLSQIRALNSFIENFSTLANLYDGLVHNTVISGKCKENKMSLYECNQMKSREFISFVKNSERPIATHRKKRNLIKQKGYISAGVLLWLDTR